MGAGQRGAADRRHLHRTLNGKERERPLYIPEPFAQWWEDAQAATLLDGAAPEMVLASIQAKA